MPHHQPIPHFLCCTLKNPELEEPGDKARRMVLVYIYRKSGKFCCKNIFVVDGIATKINENTCALLTLPW